MIVAASMGRDDLARVYIVEYPGGGRVECAESLQPPRPIEDKWVMLVSTLLGCPVAAPCATPVRAIRENSPPRR